MINPMINDKKSLSTSELQKLASLYFKMSTSARDAFIVMVITKFPDNFKEITTYLGTVYEKSITRA